MLVMDSMDVDLRKYLQQNHNQLTWKERIQIAVDIIDALGCIHKDNAIHRDLHSGIHIQDFILVILGFVGLQTNHQKVYMAIFLI